MKQKLVAALIRALRSFAQAFIGVYAVGVFAAGDLGDLADQKLITAATLAGIVALVSFVQNALENWKDVSYPRG